MTNQPTLDQIVQKIIDAVIDEYDDSAHNSCDQDIGCVMYSDPLVKKIAIEIVHQRQAVLDEVREWAKKEFEKRKEEYIKSGDEEKAGYVGYANGVISRMLKELEKAG